MRKRIAIMLICFCFCFSLAFAGGVVDNNNGNIGDVLVSTGENHGQSSTGTWTNPNFLKGEQGIQGKDGLRGERGLRGYRGTGLKDQYKVGVEVIIVDTKHTTWSAYYNRDLHNHINEAGAKCTIKLGGSYLEKQIEELNKRLERQEKIEIRRIKAYTDYLRKLEEI